jgi:hypothetical protein
MRRRLRIPYGISLRTLLLFLFPMLLDRLLAFLVILHNTPESRMLTGALAGFGLGLFFLPAWMEAWSQHFGGKIPYLLYNHKVNS